MKVDDFAKFENQNNLNVNVFEVTEDKTLTQVYVSKNMNKIINDKNQVNSLKENQMDNLRTTSRNGTIKKMALNLSKKCLLEM